MKKANVVLSTLFEDELEEVEKELEELGVSIEELRYDLLYHRYDLHAKLTLRQVYKLRKFVKSHAVNIIYMGS